MEDSEKRKERLKFMRMEAAQAEVSTSSETPGPLGGLSNPLADGTSLKMEERSSVSRFDFYTDPMAAFTGNKRSKPDKHIKQGGCHPPTHQIGSPVTQCSPSLPGPRGSHGPHQMHGHPGFYSAPARYDHNSYHMSPGVMQNPSQLHQGYTPEAWNGLRAPAGHPPLPRSPVGVPNQFQMNQGTPGTWNTSFGGRGYYPTYVPQRGSGFNHVPASAHWNRKSSAPGFEHGSTLHPSQRRGRGSRGSINQTFGQKGGRGLGFHACDQPGTVAPGPESFYKKAMEEDPWLQLEPVLWKKTSDNTSASSSNISGASDFKQSLAEYLAASLREATDEDPGV